MSKKIGDDPKAKVQPAKVEPVNKPKGFMGGVRDFTDGVKDKFQPAAEPVEPTQPVEAPLVDASGKRLHFTADAPNLLTPLIEAAWNRCRGEGDALYDACAPNFREILLANAISALKSGVVAQGDSPLEKFQAEVARISQFQDSVTEFDGVNRRVSERRVHHKSVDPDRRKADRRVVR